MGRHANSYLLLFSHPHLVESLIRGFVPGRWVQDLDFSSLEKVGASYATDDLRSRHDDLVWKIRRREAGEWVYLYLLLEFQSASEHFMALRIMSYQALLYQDLVRLLKLAPDDMLPQVLPIVLYNGPTAWRAPTNVVDLVVEGPPTLDRYRPRLEFLLLEERKLLEKARALESNSLAHLFLLAHAETEEAPAAAEALIKSLEAPKHDELRRSLEIWYRALIHHREDGVELSETLELEEIPKVLTEQTPSWTAMWTERGRQEGEAALLLRLVERRFGPVNATTQQQVMEADTDRLLKWGDRLLSAKSVEEIFAP